MTTTAPRTLTPERARNRLEQNFFTIDYCLNQLLALAKKIGQDCWGTDELGSLINALGSLTCAIQGTVETLPLALSKEQEEFKTKITALPWDQLPAELKKLIRYPQIFAGLIGT